MKKSKYSSKKMFIVTALFLVIGIGMFVFYRQRLAFQSSDNYLELALSSIDNAYRYLQITEIVKKLSYIILAIAVISCIIGLITTLFSKNKTKKTPIKHICAGCGSDMTAVSAFCPKCGHAVK